MLRTATEIDALRQAAINIAVKLAHGVAAAIGAAQFGATVAEIDGNGRLSYGELNRAEFSKSTAKLFDKAFTEIEDKLKLLLDRRHEDQDQAGEPSGHGVGVVEQSRRRACR